MAGSQGIKASLLFVFWCRVPPGDSALASKAARIPADSSRLERPFA
jgi:hypothetical protein